MPPSRPSRPERRGTLALALSALAHALVAVWLITRPAPLPPSALDVQRPPAMDIEIRTTATAKPAPLPTPPAVVAPAHKVASKRAAPSRATPATGPQGAPGGAERSPTVAEDVPHQLDLSMPKVLLPHLAGELDDLEGGHTFHEDPRAKGRPAAELAAEAQGRIEGWFVDDAAERRVADGLVDPWFAKLKKRFEHDGSKPQIVPQHVFASMESTMLKSYVSSMQRYGATGSPNASPITGGTSLPPFAGFGVNAGALMGASAAQGMVLDPASAPINTLGSAADSLSLVAVVDLNTEADGSLVSAQIVVRSGDADFDRYVLNVIPKSMEMVDPPPDAGLGLHEKGSHTVWEFAGRLTFSRDVSDINWARDGWYFVPASILGLQFDETSGYVAAADLLHPYYKCQVRLLRVY